MSGRIEYKYLVPNDLLEPIREEFLPHMHLDSYAENLGSSLYTVRSVYYDTPRFDCYLTKQEGLEMRRKFRIRGYGQQKPDSIVFLEIKMKQGMLISKHRAPLPASMLAPFLAHPDLESNVMSGPEGLDGAKRFLYHYNKSRLRPVVLVTYDREPLFGRFDRSLRITFDMRLRGRVSPALSDLYQEDGLSPAMGRNFILEVKFFRGALPVWVSRTINRYSLRRMALSKYGMCLDSSRVRGMTTAVRRSVTAARLQLV